jgi:tRNA-dihydrouridine synthase
VAQAELAGATWIDLNFGCPVKRVCGRGAGSALLDSPELLGGIVAAAVQATELPVSAKLRLGVRDASRLDEILDAAAANGACMVTLHGRTRAESYAVPAHWDLLAHAAERMRSRNPGVVFVANGGVGSADDAHRLQCETGCDAVMVGRAAIANPFVFNEACGDRPATPAEAARFALAYCEALLGRGAFGRTKQLLRVYQAGRLFDGAEEERVALLRSSEPDEVRRYLRARV